MSHDPILHVVHAAAHAKGKEGKFGAVVLIVVGIFFTPMLIGIPILLVGIAKLCASDSH